MALSQQQVDERTARLFKVPTVDAPRPRENAFTASLKSIYAPARSARRYFDHEGLERLAASLKRNGLQKAIAVRYKPGDREFERYEVITGERLFRAAQIAGLDDVAIDVYDINDAERLLRSLSDNVSQVPLTLEEEVETVGYLFTVEKLSHATINASVGRGRDKKKTGAIGSWSENRVRIYTAPDKVKSLMDDREDIIGHVEKIMSVYVRHHPDLQNTLIRMTRDNASTVALGARIEAYRAQQQRLQVLPPAPSTPMPTHQGQLPASNYDAQRIAPLSHERRVELTDIADDLRSVATAPIAPFEIAPRQPDVPAETKPRDDTTRLLNHAIAALTNAAETLTNLSRAYNESDDTARATLRNTALPGAFDSITGDNPRALIKTLQSVAFELNVNAERLQGDE